MNLLPPSSPPSVTNQVLGIVTGVIASQPIKATVYHHATAQTGAVTLIWRFGSPLNLNIDKGAGVV
jgi:hypothetical protein